MDLQRVETFFFFFFLQFEEMPFYKHQSFRLFRFRFWVCFFLIANIMNSCQISSCFSVMSGKPTCNAWYCCLWQIPAIYLCKNSRYNLFQIKQAERERGRESAQEQRQIRQTAKKEAERNLSVQVYASLFRGEGKNWKSELKGTLNPSNQLAAALAFPGRWADCLCVVGSILPFPFLCFSAARPSKTTSSNREQ